VSPGWKIGLAIVALGCAGPAAAAQQARAPGQPLAPGAAIYRSACVTCHGPDGKGSPRPIVGFDIALPDFTDCSFASAEADADWFAVIHEGGPVRGLDRHMPAFGSALTPDDITLAANHVRTFCTEPAWPRGDLNLPRAMFTEKAFPENEALWVTRISRGPERAVGNDLIYERRIGARTQVEIVAPVDFQQGADGSWTRGLGDVAVAGKRTLQASHERGRKVSGGLEVVVPTGEDTVGLGNGVTVFEPFAMWGQVLPGGAFLQMHGGAELPTDTDKKAREIFLRTAFGLTYATDRGFGRAWSPQVEVLWARPEGGEAEWDIVPQVQVTLSKLQHVALAAGFRIPLTERDDRRTQFVAYLLWDWFDGSFLEFWR
jgi:mono/diheme cytochrome c family protein